MFSVGVKNQSNISLFLISHVSKYEQDFIKRQTGTHEKKRIKKISKIIYFEVIIIRYIVHRDMQLHIPPKKKGKYFLN